MLMNIFKGRVFDTYYCNSCFITGRNDIDEAKYKPKFQLRFMEH
jgi:late competence protein required for DNA uptake (superfamily II DNA/RNA helicase)